MKKSGKIFLVLAAVVILAIVVNLYWLSRLNGDEVFPQDTFLDKVANKTALIVVAHDDDAIGCSGTVTELVKKGWKIHFLTFYGNYRKEDNPIRKKEVEQVAKIQRLETTRLVDFSIQRWDTVKEPWMPIPYSQFSNYMKVDSLKTFISEAIVLHKPSVIFSLDNIIGGYGHPEHVCVSQCVIEVCRETNNPVEKIYQAVFPRTLNENILKNNPAFIFAKKVYKAAGSPLPTTEFNISNSSKEKKEIMLAYESQKRNLKKIWPFYDYYPHWIYFRIFDKEYFNVVAVK
jgi:LmbE family N-acetylglucosaminyl deacetylase